MANEFARNIQDALINPVAFALPASASTSTNSTTIDFGADTFKPENLELELSVPALSDTIVPSTRTVTYIIETCTATNFSTIDQTLYSETFTGFADPRIDSNEQVRMSGSPIRAVGSSLSMASSKAMPRVSHLALPAQS